MPEKPVLAPIFEFFQRPAYRPYYATLFLWKFRFDWRNLSAMDSNDKQSQGLTSTQKLRLALVMLALIIVAGTAGFMTLEDMEPIDALYMTVITLSTVGYGEISTLHPEGRIFVIFLIAFGVATAGYTFSVMGETILEGHFREMFGRRKMEGKINKMSDHIIIAGYGRVGRQVAEEFQKRKISFVVIEKDEDAIVRLDRDGVMFVQGEATDDDVLYKAGIERAKTLVSTLPGEANNVYLTLTARDINRNLHIISRADYDEGIKKLKRAGANHVVSPHVLGGIRMAMASLRPNVVDFMHTTTLGEGGLSIEELVLPSLCDLNGKSLIESNLKKDYGATLIGLKKPGQEMNVAPGPETVLQAGDILVLIGKSADLESLSQAIS